VLLGGTAEVRATRRAVRIAAETALDQRQDLEIVGDTAKGKLWRVTAPVTDRVAHRRSTTPAPPRCRSGSS
jgi:hypothetical protein